MMIENIFHTDRGFIEAEELQMGDYIIFWTVGGCTICLTVLYKKVVFWSF